MKSTRVNRSKAIKTPCFRPEHGLLFQSLYGDAFALVLRIACTDIHSGSVNSTEIVLFHYKLEIEFVLHLIFLYVRCPHQCLLYL